MTIVADHAIFRALLNLWLFLMRWKIAQFIFCDQQQSLVCEQVTQQLEPMAVELLSYFCQHPDVIISREQLVNDVWLGRLVSDNAVNRVITKLRKSLNDDVRQPKFIATFPKKGYKFIADVAPVANQNLPEKVGLNSDSTRFREHKDTDAKSETRIDQPSAGLNKDKITYRLRGKIWAPLIALLVLLSVIFLAIKIISKPKIDKSLVFSNEKPLTRTAGQESRFRISSDNHFLAFTEYANHKMRLWVKSLIDDQLIEINHGEASDIWVDSGSWSDDGELFAYLVTTNKSCQYFIRQVKGSEFSAAKVIHNCPTGSYGKIAFTHDNDRVVYAESSGRGSAFSLFELTLSSGKKRRLNQPELVNGGNVSFDLHPLENKLLISSPDKQQWEAFYSLDMTTDELILLFKQDSYICCGIWSHDGQRIVLMGNHPANQLVSYDLKGNDRQLVYSGGLKLDAPERHANGKDYLFVAGDVNYDVEYFDFITQQSQVIADSSVDDRLATMSYQDNTVAYIGLASGNEEVWFAKRESRIPNRLTQFNDNRHYLDLKWAYNGQFILGLTFNEIHVIDSTTGSVQILKIPQVEMSGLSFKNDSVITFSTRTNSRWQVNQFNLQSQQFEAVDSRWQFIRYAYNPQDSLWLDQDNLLYSGELPKKVEDPEIQQKPLIWNRSFNLAKNGKRWTWSQEESGRFSIMQKLGADPVSLLVSADSAQYDLIEKGLIYHTMKNANADIYQTMSDF